jgi:hypothetical protein
MCIVSDSKKIMFVLQSLLLCSCASVSARGPAVMPDELLGTWEYGYARCTASVFGESDSAIRIESTAIVGHEHRDDVKSVEKLSDAPSAWKVHRVSDAAPEAVQDQAEIFVRNGDRMTVTDGENARTYTRCT